MISVSIAIAFGKSVPTCVFYRETFFKKCSRQSGRWVDSSKNFGIYEGLVSLG